MVTHLCPQCSDLMPEVTTSTDSDGTSWTWVTNKHACGNCGYHSSETLMYHYNHEEFPPRCACEGDNPYIYETMNKTDEEERHGSR